MPSQPADSHDHLALRSRYEALLDGLMRIERFSRSLIEQLLDRQLRDMAVGEDQFDAVFVVPGCRDGEVERDRLDEEVELLE